MGIGMVLNQRFEVNIKVRENTRQQRYVSGDVDFDLSARKLREDIAPTAVSEEKHGSRCLGSTSQLQTDSHSTQTEIPLSSIDSGSAFILHQLSTSFRRYCTIV